MVASNMPDMQAETFFTVSTSLSSLSAPFCRICHCTDGKLVKPCKCCGTIAYVHNDCLMKWVKQSGRRRCQICAAGYAANPGLKPVREWTRPSLVLGVIFVFTLLLIGYHSVMLYKALDIASIEDPRIWFYIFMICCDGVAFAWAVIVYSSNQIIMRYSNRKGSSEASTVSVV